MAVEVILLETVVDWYEAMTEAEKDDFEVAVDLLEQEGVALGFPWSSAIKGASLGGMRELRYQHQGHPFRVLYAFDPSRQAILLLGGDKSGDGRWYRRNVPRAQRLFQEYLASSS